MIKSNFDKLLHEEKQISVNCYSRLALLCYQQETQISLTNATRL